MKRFNIRIYGIVINEREELLLSKESHEGKHFTKFPGGGLEWGEGTIDCLKREFQEEFKLDIEVGELFYLTDFFQMSAFSDHDQVMSVYYRIKAKTEPLDDIIKQGKSKEEIHWVPLKNLTLEHATFPIDKKVVSMILAHK